MRRVVVGLGCVARVRPVEAIVEPVVAEAMVVVSVMSVVGCVVWEEESGST